MSDSTLKRDLHSEVTNGIIFAIEAGASAVTGLCPGLGPVRACQPTPQPRLNTAESTCCNCGARLLRTATRPTSGLASNNGKASARACARANAAPSWFITIPRLKPTATRATKRASPFSNTAMCSTPPRSTATRSPRSSSHPSPSPSLMPMLTCVTLAPISAAETRVHATFRVRIISGCPIPIDSSQPKQQPQPSPTIRLCCMSSRIGLAIVPGATGTLVVASRNTVMPPRS